MQKILVPVDGSTHSLKAVAIASDLAGKYSGQIVLVHVLLADKRPHDILDLVGPGQLGARLEARLRKEVDQDSQVLGEDLLNAVGARILEHAGERIRRRELDVEVLPMVEGNPVEAILEARDSTEAVTIVMGCRGAGSPGGSTFGSVSNAIFQRADCTCIAVK